MSQNLDALYLVYSFVNTQEREAELSPARYHIRGVYHDRGAIPVGELQEMAKSIIHENFMELFFNSLDEIKSFGDRLFNDYSAESLYLLSAQDFNLALEATSEASKLSENLKKYGERLVNEDVAKSKGFLSKFFR